MAHGARASGPNRAGKFCWDCAQCGAWSRGYRYSTANAAQRAAERHDALGEADDRRIHQMLYGGKRRSDDPRGRADA